MKLFAPKSKSTTGRLSREEALQCIPVKHLFVSCTELDSGEIQLEYPLPLKPLLQSLFQRFSKTNVRPTKKLLLDDMGTMVWNHINGKDSTKSIISSFANQYGLTIQEAEMSVTAFLVELGKRGLIAMR